MPDVGDFHTPTLTVSPFDGTTAATVVITRPDATTTSPATATSDGGATWTATSTQFTLAGTWLEDWTVTGTGKGVQQFRVTIPATPTGLGAPYVSVAELKGYLNLLATDTTEDDRLQTALTTASSWVRKFCGRDFNKTSTASARVFRPRDNRVCVVDDFWSTTGLLIGVDYADDGTYTTPWTVAAGDVELQPYNGTVDGEPGWPYNALHGINQQFTCSRRPQVRLTAKWGWDAVPEPVRQATVLRAEDIYKLKGSPFGVAGDATTGPIFVRDNRAVLSLLRPYRATAAAVMVG